MRYLSYVLLFSLCVAYLFIAGCSQPIQSGIQIKQSPPTEQVTPLPTMQQTAGQQKYIVAVTAQKVGDNLVITFQGGSDTDKLLHSTVSVNGIEQSKKLGTIPGDTITLEKVATKYSDHVVVIGYFNDGSSQTILDIDTNTPGTGEIYYRPPPEGYRPQVNTVPPITYRPQMRY